MIGMRFFGLQGRFALTLGFAVGSFLLLTVLEVVNQNRLSWLGVQPGYAPHNFAFNLSFYLPVLLLSTVLALLASTLYFTGLRARRHLDERAARGERLSILPALPVLCFVLLKVLWVGLLVMR